MSSPENVGSVASDAFVVWIIGLGRGEGRMLGDHDEEYHARREQVSLLALVRLVEVDLGRHIIECAQLSVQISASIAALNRSSESKISNFKIKILTQEQVFGLKVTMTDLVHVAVVEAGHELFEVVPRFVLVEWARIGYEIEQLASGGEF